LIIVIIQSFRELKKVQVKINRQDLLHIKQGDKNGNKPFKISTFTILSKVFIKLSKVKT